MADLETSSWSETAASNNTATPNGWPEGMLPSDVNNCARENMAALKRDWNRSHTTIASTGSANAYVLTFTTAPTAYANGQQVAFNANFTNSGSASANVNTLGAITIQKQTSSGMANLASGDIQSGQHVILEYDSGLTKFILLNPQAGSALATPVTVANGGTGVATLTAHGVLVGEGTSNVAITSAGTAGQLLTSGGASADPSFKNVSPVTTKTADYVLLAADQGGTFVMNSASTHTFTLPDDATVASGWSVRIINQGAGVCTIAAAGTDTIASGGSTALASIKLSQGDAGDVTADGVSHGIFWWRGSRHYDSGQQTITSAGALTLAHGLGVQPSDIQMVLHCTTNDSSYVVGNELPRAANFFESDTSGINGGLSTIADATNLTVRYCSNTSAFAAPNASSGAQAGLTNGSWKAIWRAWVYD